MLQRRIVRLLFGALVVAAFGLAGCEETLIEPEFTGGLRGTIVDAETGAPIAGASVSTSPPSSALVTGSDGTFEITGLVVGNYTITATKPGYESGGISVAVREGETATASLPLTAIPPDDPTLVPDVQAEILNWVTTQSGDSSFVEVQYRVDNVGRALATSYEVYVETETTGDTFYDEIAGDSLRAGQSDIGRFVRYIYTQTATDVRVNGVWVEDQDGLRRWTPASL